MVHDRHRNLVVAATGTGKTVIAALDYRRLCVRSETGRGCCSWHTGGRSLSSRCARTARSLATVTSASSTSAALDPSAGEHVFASVQSLTAYGVSNIPADAFDVVVIDEFHHAEARTYRRLIDHLRPQELLGLTATPERADGIDVRSFFDGRTAAELRLWDALGADSCAHSTTSWSPTAPTSERSPGRAAGTTRRELSNVYTGNDARAADRAQSAPDKVIDVGAMRALGFCVSVAHAEYMAAVFNEAGHPSASVSGQTTRPNATSAPRSADRDVSTSSLRPTYSTRASTSPTSTPFCSSGRPRAPRSSSSSSAAGSAAPRQGGAHGPRLRRLPPQRVSLRPEAAGADRSHVGRARASGEDGFPFLPSGCFDRDGPSVADPGPGKHSVPDRQPLAADRCRAARPPATGTWHEFLDRVRHRAQRHSAPRKSLMDAPTPRRWSGDSTRAPSSRIPAQARARVRPRGRSGPRRRRIGGSSPMTHRRTTHWLHDEQRLHGCCSSPCGRTAVATPRSRPAWRHSETRRQRGAKSHRSSTFPSTRPATSP